MLVAKRDPFHPGANEYSLPRGEGAPKLARALSALQIAGTLLAVPLGLGSVYSMYRANFSVETTCQSLRANIVAMLDRSVDATARHMLVRRDVEAFERNCGGVDPDATAAFKTLLAADKKLPSTVVPVSASAASGVAPQAEVKPDVVIRKIEMRPSIVAKLPAATPAAADVKPRDPAISDAAWLGAVRQALVKQGLEKQGLEKREAEPALASAAAPAPFVSPPPAAQPVKPVSLEQRPLGELRGPIPAATPPASLAPPVPNIAPALPPAASIESAPARHVDDGHPVPPEAIPDAVPETAAGRSRIGALIAKIPFVGKALER